MTKKKEEIPGCSFCGRPATIADLIPSGDGSSYICVDCVDNIYHTLEQMDIIAPSKQKAKKRGGKNGSAQEELTLDSVPSPRHIKEIGRASCRERV